VKYSGGRGEAERSRGPVDDFPIEIGDLTLFEDSGGCASSQL
jgi:hypothetical protein